MSEDVGTGVSLGFTGSSFAMNITNMDLNGISREAIDMSHLGSSAVRAFIFGKLYDPGGLDIDYNFNPALLDDIPIFTSSTADTLTITFGSSETWSFPGQFTEIGISIPVEDKMVGSGTIKASGAITLLTST